MTLDNHTTSDHSGSFASSASVRRRMQLQRIRETEPELSLRRTLHSLGLRYRLDLRPDPSVRRRADIVFTKTRVAVFVDGCFWHNCPEHGSMPRQNVSYWEPKLHRNAERDAETTRLLQERGWEVIRIWEHEDPRHAAERIKNLVESRRASAG